MLLFHIFIALLSLITASFAAYHPTKNRLTFAYTATGGTLASGILLVILESASVAHVCISGGVYLVAVAILILIARKKIATVPLY